MKRAWIVFAVAATLLGASGFKRAALISMEKSFDRRITAIADDPYILVGFTRGVYLEGYGAVFTAEVNLAIGPAQSPFRPVITKEDIQRIRGKKLDRLPILRESMRQTLLDAASSLDEVPATEQIVVGVSLLYRADEDASGMPGQILMQGERGKLVDAKLGRVSLDTVVKVREF
jgi:hypothetical protein